MIYFTVLFFRQLKSAHLIFCCAELPNDAGSDFDRLRKEINMRYENEICQGCGKRFEAQDDIVVCPECGTPQHRECYKLENRCVNEHLHTDGFEWKPKHVEKEEDTPAPIPARVCPFCGHSNPSDAKECENCGQLFELFGKSIFPEKDETTDNGDFGYKPPFDIDGTPPKTEEPPFSAYGFSAQENFTDSENLYPDEEDGVSSKDIVSFVRTNSPTYLRKFGKISRKSPTFNFAAFFFGPFWFFYRKLIKPGIVFLTVSLCLSIAFSPHMNQFMEKFSSVASGQMLTAEDLTEENLEQIQENLFAVLNESMPFILLFWGLQLVFRLIMALTADRAYRKKVLSDIKRINSECGSDGKMKYISFMKNGGTSFTYFMLCALAEYMIEMLVTTVFFN